MAAIVPFETLPQLFRNLADHYQGQNRPALSYKDKKTKVWLDIPWDALMERVNAFAGYLHSRGIRAGDRVAILSENRPEWAITDMATQMLGAINVSLYTSLPASEVAYILNDSGAKLFVVSAAIQLRKAEEVFDDCPALQDVVTMSEMRKAHPGYVIHWDEAMTAGRTYWAAHEAELKDLYLQVQPHDVAALIYTSGTTGSPKGVMLTHDNLCSNARSALTMVPFGPADHHLSFLPLSHSFERTAGYTAVLACGARITYAESIDAVSKNLPEVHPTVMISVPRLFERVYNIIAKSVEEGSSTKQKIFNWAVATGWKVAQTDKPGPVLRVQQKLAHRLVFAKLHEKLGGNVRFAVSGGAALPKAIGEFFQAAGIMILEGYGLTETSPVLSVSPYGAPVYGTVGYIIPGIVVGIQSLKDGTILAQLSGEDYPSTLSSEEGEIVAKGPNIMKGYWNNDAATQGAIDDAGWYHTGDVGRFENGYLRITDRIKHMLVSKGGKNIYPGPIEEKFTTVPWIDQIMVVGEGQAFLSALVVPSMDALISHAKEQGVAYEKPSALLEAPEILDLFKKEFRSYSKQAAPHEKIRDFRLISEPFSVENGMMTPTLKLRRKIITKHYADLIDTIYADVV